MKLVFVDETGNSQHLPGFYAACAVCVDATKYKVVRDEVEKALASAGWDRVHEFKGSAIFSSTKGDTGVDIDGRIDVASQIVSSTVSKSNSRATPVIAWNTNGDSTGNHLDLVEKAVAKCLPKATTGKDGKDLCVVFVDQKDGVPKSDLLARIRQAAVSRGYSVVEDIVVVTSSCDAPGIMLADILAYLGMWTYADHTLGKGQQTLFDDSGTTPTATMIRKMESVRQMLESGSDLRFSPKLSAL